MKDVRKIEVPSTTVSDAVKKSEEPDTKEMSFPEFTSYWRSISANPPDNNTILTFRIWCEKRNEWLETQRKSNTKESNERYERHDGRLIKERNELGFWKQVLWEFAFGNAELGSKGRPNFMGMG